MKYNKKVVYGRSFESRKEYADLLLAIEGGRDNKTIAFIESDGTSGGCCRPEKLQSDERYGNLDHVSTTWEKYTYFKTSVIDKSQL